MDNLSLLYYKSALELGLSPIAVPEIDGFKIIVRGQLYFFRGGHTPFNDDSSISVCGNKYCSNLLWRNEKIPVPKANAFTKDEFKSGDWSLNGVRFPLVLKPTMDSSCGESVICNIRTEQKLIKCMQTLFEKYECLSVEEFESGLRSYRVLVYFGEVIGVVERTPACVVGDGKHSIRELIDIKNKARKEIEALPLGPLSVDEETYFIFRELGLTEESILPKNEICSIRYICNSTVGGTCKSLKTSAICKENAELAIRAAKALNLNFVGFDVLCENIGRPIEKSRGFFIEGNFAPDITIHENCPEGNAVRVTKLILMRLLYRTKWGYKFKRFLVVHYIFSSIAITFLIVFVMLILWRYLLGV